MYIQKSPITVITLLCDSACVVWSDDALLVALM